MLKKNEIESGKEKAINEIKKNNSFILSTDGTVVVIGSKIDVMTDIVFLICQLLKNLPQNTQKYILASLICALKDDDNISDEDEELAQKVLDKIKELN